MTKKNEESLAEFRYEMLQKGYMNKKELARFIGCGYKMANKAFDQMSNDLFKEGIEKLDGNVLLTKRVINFIGLTEKKIIDSYERERMHETPVEKSA